MTLGYENVGLDSTLLSGATSGMRSAPSRCALRVDRGYTGQSRPSQADKFNGGNQRRGAI